MKITIDAEALSGAAGLAYSFIGAHPSSSVMGCILLVASEGQLSITAGDMINFIQMQIECGVQRAGRICLPAQTFKAYLEKAVGGIVIDCDGSVAKLKTGRSTATIRGYSGDDYPEWSESSTEAVTLNAKDMIGLIRSVSGSAAKQSARPALVGVNLSPINGDLWFMAGDGHRLSVNRIPGMSIEERFTIPLETVRRLVQVLKEGENAQIRLHKNSAVIQVENIAVRFQLIDAAFPALENAVPTEFTGSVLVNREELMQEIESALVIAPEGTRRLAFQVEEAKFGVKAELNERGDYSAEIDAQVKGEIQGFLANGEYLLEALKNIPYEDAAVSISPHGAICVTSPVDENVIHIIMPMR